MQIMKLFMKILCQGNVSMPKIKISVTTMSVLTIHRERQIEKWTHTHLAARSPQLLCKLTINNSTYGQYKHEKKTHG